MTEFKVCSDCSARKIVPEDFHKAFLRKDGSQAYAGYCKDCAKIRAQKWYRKNHEQNKERARKIQANRRERGLNQDRERWYKIRNKYGLSKDDWYVLYEGQGKCCAICAKQLTERWAFVDHDHITGKVRGILCTRCNLCIGQFEDNPVSLRNAAQYLLRASS